MIQDIKPGSQSTSPSLIILGQSIVYAEIVAKQTGPNRRNNRFSAPSDECLSKRVQGSQRPNSIGNKILIDNVYCNFLKGFFHDFISLLNCITAPRDARGIFECFPGNPEPICGI